MKIRRASGRRKGQTLVLTPFLIVIIMGSIALMIAVSQINRQRIQTQLAADAAARNAALMQANGIMTIAYANDRITEIMGEMQAACSLAETGWGLVASIWPWDVIEGIEDLDRAWDELGDDIEQLNGVIEQQEDVMDLFEGDAIVLAPMVAATTDQICGSAEALIMPEVSSTDLHITLGKQWGDTQKFLMFFMGTPGWAISMLDANPYAKRTDENVPELIQVAVTNEGSPILGQSLLGISGPPRFNALSAAKPYYFGGSSPFSYDHDPTDNTLSSGEQTVSMHVAWPDFWYMPIFPVVKCPWDAKLVPVQTN
jgi:hypothetical protein